MIDDIEIAGICLKHHALLLHGSPPVSATNQSGIVWRVDFSDAYCPEHTTTDVDDACEASWKAVVL